MSSFRIPLTPSQAVHLNGLVNATQAATLAQQVALQAVALAGMTAEQFATCTNLLVTADAIVCTLPDDAVDSSPLPES